MRKLSKVLSILLAMVLIFTTASIGVEAQYHAYKDTEDMSYDSIDQPILSVDQYASMAMDELDRMLMKENITFSYEVMGLGISADFSTIDNCLESIKNVLNVVGGVLGQIGGDIGGDESKGLDGLDFSALCTKDESTGKYSLACPKRGTANVSELEIFKAVFQFLADNADILAKVPKGSTANGGLDLGALSGFIDLGDKLNVPALAKKAVAKFMDADYIASKSLDTYVAEFLEQVLGGTYPKTGNSKIYWVSQELQYYVPGIAGEIDFLHESVYDIIEKCVRAALDSQKAMDYINTTVQRWLRQFCGYAYTKSKDSNGKTIYTRNPSKDKVNEDYEALVNLNFHLTSFNTSSWAANTTFVDHVNDILGKIVEAAFSQQAQITWNYANGNNGLFANLRAAVEKVLEYTGTGLFASYVEVLPIAKVRSLTDDQFVAYILRSTMNGSIDAVYITADVDNANDPNNTTLGVLFETVRTLAGEVVPSQNYDNMEVSLDNMIKMGLDMAAAGLRGISSLDLDYGLDMSDFVEEAMDWVIEKYGGFVDGLTSTGWDAVNDVFFTIIPADWLPVKATDNSARDDLESILFDDIINNVLDFNLPALLKLFSRNATGELSKPLIEVLTARITSVINFVIPGTFPEADSADYVDYTTLEGLLNTNLLSDIIRGLVTGLNDRFDDLAPSLLPVVCAALDLSSPEEFGYPYVSLTDSTLLDPTIAQTFYMYNGSSGINTAWTDKTGTVTTQDHLYKYYINSITVDNDDVEVVLNDQQGSDPAGTWINGGRSQSFKFTGDLSAAEDTVLTVTIDYDVYGETDEKMTPNALTATCYVFVSSTADDSEELQRKKDPNQNNLHVVYQNNGIYFKKGATLNDVADIEIEVRRNVSKKSSNHTANATVTSKLISVDSALTALGVNGNSGTTIASTNKDGGSYKFHPYTLATTANPKTKIPVDEETSVSSYTNTIRLMATKTETEAENWENDQTIVVYDDYNLASYLNSAVKADRQQSSFGTGSFTAKYIPFDNLSLIPDKATEQQLEALKITKNNVNGAAAWDRYIEAIRSAAAVLYAPRQAASFAEAAVEFKNLAKELYDATQELEACSVSSGAAGIKTELDKIVPDNTYLVYEDDGVTVKKDDEGNDVRETYEYYDAKYGYFAREDYVSYTYSRFKPERRAAERLISRWNEAQKGKDVEPISAVEAAYATHRLKLYAARLIRVRAYKEHLNSAIETYRPLLNAGRQGKYSTESWDNFVTAFNFATTVNAKQIGQTYSNSENLQGDGLRQSMVNEARGQLIKAAKKLAADYSKLKELVENNKSIYQSSGADYPAVEWAAFRSAYQAAQGVIANLTATQDQIDQAYNTLLSAIEALNPAGGDGLEIVEYEGWLPVLFEVEESNKFMVGLNDESVEYVPEFLKLPAGYTYTMNASFEEDDLAVYSTGSVLTVFDKNGNEVETYLIVLYGDGTGEGFIDVEDIMLIISAIRKENIGDWVNAEFADEYSVSMALDLDHDTEVGVADMMDIIAQIRGLGSINQNWTQEGDPELV